MKKLLFLILLVPFISKAQLPVLPAYTYNPNATTSNSKGGWQTLDSGLQLKPRVKNFQPKSGYSAIRISGDTLYYWSTGAMDWVAVTTGGLVTTPTWQQTLIAGSTLTQNNTVDGDQHEFTFDNFNTFQINTFNPGTNEVATVNLGQAGDPLQLGAGIGSDISQITLRANGMEMIAGDSSFIAYTPFKSTFTNKRYFLTQDQKYNLQRVDSIGMSGLLAGDYMQVWNGKIALGNTAAGTADPSIRVGAAITFNVLKRANLVDAIGTPFMSKLQANNWSNGAYQKNNDINSANIGQILLQFQDSETRDTINNANSQGAVQGILRISRGDSITGDIHVNSAGTHPIAVNNASKQLTDWDSTGTAPVGVTWHDHAIIPVYKGIHVIPHKGEGDYTQFFTYNVEKPGGSTYTQHQAVGYEMPDMSAMYPTGDSMFAAKQFGLTDYVWFNSNRIYFRNAPAGIAVNTLGIDANGKLVTATAATPDFFTPTIATMQAITTAYSSVYVQDTLRGGWFNLVNSGSMVADNGVRFAATGIGANYFWVRQINPTDPIRFDWYNPAKDSSADISATYRIAIAQSVSLSKPLYVSAGFYQLDSNIYYPGNFVLKTAGVDAVVFVYKGAGAWAQGMHIDSTTKVQLGDFTIRRRSKTVNTGGNPGLKISNSTYITLGALKVFGEGNSALSVVDNSQHINFYSFEGHDISSQLFGLGQGVFIEHSNDVTGISIFCDSCKSALDINRGASNVHITTITAYNNNDNGVDLGSSQYGWFGNIHIKNTVNYPTLLTSQNQQAFQIKVENDSVGTGSSVIGAGYYGSYGNYFGNLTIEGSCLKTMNFALTSTITGTDNYIHDNTWGEVYITTTIDTTAGITMNTNSYNNVIQWASVLLKKSALTGSTDHGLTINGGLLRSTRSSQNAVDLSLVKALNINNTTIISDSAIAVNMSRCDSITLNNNNISAPRSYGINYTDGASGGNLPTSINISRNKFNNVGYNGILYTARSTAYNNFIGVNILNNNFDSISTVASTPTLLRYAIHFDNPNATAATGLNIQNNVFTPPTNNAYNGILLNGSGGAYDKINVSNNNFYSIDTFFTATGLASKAIYIRGVDTTSNTVGQIPFVGSNFEQLRHSTNLLWDNTNSRLLVDTAAGSRSLTLSGTSNGIYIARNGATPHIELAQYGGAIVGSEQQRWRISVGNATAFTGNLTFFSVNNSGTSLGTTIQFNRAGGAYLGYAGADALPASAIFATKSTTQGWLPPILTTAQQNAISSPATGLIIWNSDSLNLCRYNGTAWRSFGGLTGNGNYIINGTTQQATSNFNISGIGVIGSTASLRGNTLLQVGHSAVIKDTVFAGSIVDSGDIRLPGSGTIYMQSQSNAPAAAQAIVWDATGHLTLQTGVKLAITSQTTTYAILATDYYIDCNGTFTATLPTAVAVSGQTYVITNTGSGTITLATTGGQTISGSATKTLNVQYSGYVVKSDGTNWLICGTF